ncbi:MAG TPA: GMC oxidoreductase [Hyalangium sp.]|jgi:choline dehydrogenase|nr:GMC oxidoreductase [Hyalangium sp.]
MRASEPGDPAYQLWLKGQGVYTTNGAVLAVIKKSAPERSDPDLFIFALPGNFHGYYRGYSQDTERTKNYLTWAILSVVDAVEFVRDMSKRNSDIKQEIIPGKEVQSAEQIAQFVKDNAWGHHASCSNPMGPASNSNAVVDSNFRVHGTKGLRIVDASVFPRIPGFFIVTPIHMIAEKASDVIIADAKNGVV